MESKRRWNFFLFFFSIGKLADIRRLDSRLVPTIHFCRPLKNISSAIHATENFAGRESSSRPFSHPKKKNVILRTILGHFLSIGHEPNTFPEVYKVETERVGGSWKMKEDSDSIDEIRNVDQMIRGDQMTDVNKRSSSANQSGGITHQEQDVENHQRRGENMNTLEQFGGFLESPSRQETHSFICPGGNDVEYTNSSTMNAERSESSQSLTNKKETDESPDIKPLVLDTPFDPKPESELDNAEWTIVNRAKYKQRKGDKRKEKPQLNASLEDGKSDAAGTCVNGDNGLFSPRNKRPKRIQPNFFLAVRIHNPQIHTGIKVIQDSIATHNKKLKPAFVSLATLHVTLMVMHLEDAKEIEKAGRILHQCKTSLEPILAKSAMMLRFSGLGHFRQQVLYAKLEEEGRDFLKSVAEILREIFTKEGIPSTDSREYNPHMTVMKLTGHNPQLRRNGVKKIPEESYSSWVDLNFGEEQVSALHLCAMGEKDKDGFYKCMATVTFGDSDKTSSS